MSTHALFIARTENGTWSEPLAMRSMWDGIWDWNLLTDAQRAEHGWYPLVEVGAAFDPSTQVRSGPVYSLAGGVVTGTYTVNYAPQLAAASVETEKLRRIKAGFPFLGKVIQSRAEDRENIAGAKSAAQDAKLLGAEPGELSWQKRLDAEKGAEIFAWITLDNSMLPLDADAMIAMGYAAMLHKQRLIFVAKSIKDRLAAGEEIADVTADALWS